MPINDLFLKFIGKETWRIETLFRQFKIDLSADILKSQSSTAIYKEIAARICAINIISMIMLDAAIANNVDVTRISFIHTVRAIIAFAPALAMRPVRRLEPRRLAHSPKSYPLLKTTRAQWRKQNAA